MPPRMVWLARVVALAIVPVIVGAVQLVSDPRRTTSDLAAAGCLLVLAATHVVYWWRPWPAHERRAFLAVAVMVLSNFVLLDVLGFTRPLLGFTQPLLWLYPALVLGAGLRPPAAAVGIGLMALAAAAPVAMEGLFSQAIHNRPEPLGPGHSILLSIVLAGLGMSAVRQLITVNADLHATRAELAELAVARERERLALELHDLLGRTLSLIAVKAELANRLSAKGDVAAEVELADVQRLARQAVRDVREAVAGTHAPSVDGELSAGERALRAAGIEVTIDNVSTSIDPAHESTMAWALREAVTNVVKHSYARACRIALHTDGAVTTLEVEDDGRGPLGRTGAGTGLNGLAERVSALGGAFEAGPSAAGGFRVRVQLAAAARREPRVEVGA